MCYEDVKIGLRRYARVSINPTSIPADKRRVALRLCGPIAGGSANQASIVLSGGAGNGAVVLHINEGNSVDEITLERHGTLVQAAFTAGYDLDCGVIEILDSELDKPPAAGNPYDSVSRSK